MAQKFTRKFTFGPLEFDDLDGDLDYEAVRKRIIDALEQSQPYKDATGGRVCVHGLRVLIKDRSLKRSSSLLKHSRFALNFVVTPVWPVEVKSADDKEDGDGNQDQDD